MTIKRVLAILNALPTDTSVMTCAYLVAQRFGAHAEVTYVKDETGPAHASAYESVAMSMGGEWVSRFAEEEERNVAEVQSAYQDFVTSHRWSVRDTPQSSNEASVEWRAFEGYAPAVVTSIGGAHDLIVIGRPTNESPTTLALAIESALFETGRPVLIAPPDPPKKLGEVVLIGWNRGAQAARAFHAAKALLLESAQTVRLLSVTTGAKEGPAASEIVENLAWHGIKADVEELSPDHRSVGAVLLAEASAIGADLVVTGAFSHSRLRNLILGGVTGHVLENAEVPVLMAH